MRFQLISISRLLTPKLDGHETWEEALALENCTWEEALLWSRRVRQEKFSLGMEGADLEAIRQLVLAGFPTTSTWAGSTTHRVNVVIHAPSHNTLCWFSIPTP